ncbi:hypothetical protein [Blastococcus sp. Marseille-P5729]|uniref:hypothetical protein n=1 Tax=Blastococcus sp. Marseille-P5729 TaxID=2086582 RepID=UPI000D107B28|nr:hypothetical protein [Blastococcus sp. Marseille-P5729]
MHHADEVPMTWHSRTADAVPVDDDGKPCRITLEQTVTDGQLGEPLVYVEVTALTVDQDRVPAQALSELVEAFDAAR